jgi:hypothetical protein
MVWFAAAVVCAAQPALKIRSRRTLEPLRRAVSLSEGAVPSAMGYERREADVRI